jgi:anhydro-N-acetylmuramic acid kinase
MKILGVMTGTSCDALDCACVEVDSRGWEPIWAESKPYPPALRKRVIDAQKPKTQWSAKSWLELDRDLGNWYGSTLKHTISVHREKPLIIANHGQTLAHYPETKNQGTTLQMGDPSRVAAMTGLTVISQFRTGDMAAGGQGAPLLPLFHSILASVLDPHREGIAFQNLGGISNLTYVSPREQIFAFDTGPANIWIDYAAQQASRGKLTMDVGGKLGAQGKIHEPSLKKLLAHPYFKKPIPKSTGRDDFTLEYFADRTSVKGADLVATATALTVETVAQAYENFILRKKFPLKKVFVVGGGAKNPFLLKSLSKRLPKIEIKTLDKTGFDSQWVEAQGFALFGWLALQGKPVGGSWTGAKSFGPPAHIIPGENWSEVLGELKL